MDAYQQFIHKSRYARFREDLGRREHWDETVDRYVEFFEDHIGSQTPYKLTKDDMSLMREGITSLDVMPSMRCLMTAGDALRLNHMAGFNCSYLPIDNKNAFSEILYVLMCGTGLGFSVERQVIKMLPEVPPTFTDSDLTFIIQDSKEGWASSFQNLIDCLYRGVIPKFDSSLVRPAGAPLKTFGGRASGPEPLLQLFRFVTETFRCAAGRKLTSLECHDIACMIGDVVVVGGVRRSALISLSNLSDDRMRSAKSGEWWKLHPYRQMANNSSAYTERPEVGVWMREWNSIYESKSGERGVFNREACNERVKSLPTGRVSGYDWGVNPCVTGDTPILTDKGYAKIQDTVDQEVSVWNGSNFSKVKPFSTGVNSILRIKFSDGSTLRTTPAHKFLLSGAFTHGRVEEHGRKKVHKRSDRVNQPTRGKIRYRTRVEAKQLRPGDKLAKFAMPVIQQGISLTIDAYSQGFYSGDGTTDSKRSYVYEPKYEVIGNLVGEVRPALEGYSRRDWVHGNMLAKNFVPLQADLRYKLEWLAGILDSDGCVVRDKSADGLQISSIDENFLLDIRLMLTTMGITAKVLSDSRAERESSFYSKDGVPYPNQPGFRLVIAGMETFRLQQLGLRTHRLELRGTEPQRSATQYVKVVSIDEEQPQETFCFTESEFHLGCFNGLVTGNCGEIILRPRGLCNLSEAVVRPTDTPMTLERKVRLATILGTLQSTLTNYRFVSDQWQKNSEEERLLGVSMTGILSNRLFHENTHNASRTLQSLRACVHEENRDWARRLHIDPSAAMTTVKPSGTVSQLVYSPSGIHADHSEYYCRTVRADRKDPLCQFLIDSGVTHEPAVGKEDSVMVFSFPKRGYGLTRRDMTALKQLEIVDLFAQNWTDHNVSCTVSVRDKEWPEVGAWMWNHLDTSGGLAFLPMEDHIYQQAPYQDLTEQEYNSLVARTPKSLDWEELARIENGQDNTSGTKELACSAGVCEIVDLVKNG